MSNENFDNNIRKKLESIEPEYSADAWQKFRTSLPVPWYIALFRDFGGWIYGGLASVALLGAFYANYTTKKENQLLHEEISTLKQQQIIRTDTVYINNTPTLRDTVYVVRYVVKEQPAKWLAGESATGPARQTAHAYPPSGLPEATSGTSSQGSDPVITTSGNDPQVSSENDSRITTSGKEKEEKFEEKENKDEPKVPELKIPVKEELPEEKKKFRFPYIHARVGLGSDYLGFKLPALGPDVEVFLNDRISFNTGLVISGQQTMVHSFAKDFNMATGKKFEDEYKGYMQGSTPVRIENISIKTSYIKLPIFFNYYIPASRNFSFMVSAGTKLDLSVYQAVSYTSGALGAQFLSRFEASPKPATFNSLFYGLGAQYRHKRLVMQFSPYFDFPFRNLSYNNIPRKFGINASVKIDLGKQ